MARFFAQEVALSSVVLEFLRASAALAQVRASRQESVQRKSRVVTSVLEKTRPAVNAGIVADVARDTC
jgi:hypothetical protein